jgi:hypothetical protein
VNALVRCWIVLREYDYEGKEVVAVFSAEMAANEFCEKQERTCISRCIVEEWQIQRTPNAERQP